MTHVVAQPCFGCKYTDCVVVCPVECFYEGEQILYIHPDECIDCEACVPECPYEAIFPEEEVPFDYTAPADGIWICDTKELLPDGAPFEGEIGGHEVKLLNAQKLEPGTVLDLTEDIPPNYDFFSEGPGYDAME